MKKVLVILALLVLAPISAFSSWIEPGLKAKLARLENDDTIRVIIHLKERVDWGKISPFADNRTKVPYLINFAQNSQKELLKMLDELSKSHQVLNINSSFWNSNIIIVSVAEKDVIEQIASHPDVAYIAENGKVYSPELIPGRMWSLIDSVQWNIAMVRAPEVWELGCGGAGVVVGLVGTGVSDNHWVIRGKMMEGGWFDAIYNWPWPFDNMGPGTHAAGVVCGDYGFGMAPKARYAMAKIFDAGGDGGTYKEVHMALQWYASLCTLQVYPRVICNLWGDRNTASLEVWEDISNLRELGLIPISPIGDAGMWGTSTPGNYPTNIGVGAVNRLLEVTDASSKGPAPKIDPWSDTCNWGRDDWNFFKPDIVGAGEDVASCFCDFEGDTIRSLSGTFISAAQIAGAIALILEKYPNLSYTEAYLALLDNTARAKHPNNSWGWGLLDALQAFISLGVEERNIGPLSHLKLRISPNPASFRTRISFYLPVDSRVRINLYNLAGQKVKVLLDSYKEIGAYSIEAELVVPSGIYFCSLETEKERRVVKLTIVK